MRRRELDPDAAIVRALEEYLGTLQARLGRLQRLLGVRSVEAGDDVDTTELGRLVRAVADRSRVEAEDDLAWQRADLRLRQALFAYRRRGR